IHYPFSAEQIDAFRDLAAVHGHTVVHANDAAAALAAAPDTGGILGYFSPDVCAAASCLRWILSYSAGMDKFLFPEIVERDEVQISNMAGLYASQGGEHAWALLLALTRQVPAAVQNKQKRQWAGGTVVEVTGSTLGVIGMGGFGLE